MSWWDVKQYSASTLWVIKGSLVGRTLTTQVWIPAKTFYMYHSYPSSTQCRHTGKSKACPSHTMYVVEDVKEPMSLQWRTYFYLIIIIVIHFCITINELQRDVEFLSLNRRTGYPSLHNHEWAEKGQETKCKQTSVTPTHNSRLDIVSSSFVWSTMFLSCFVYWRFVPQWLFLYNTSSNVWVLHLVLLLASTPFFISRFLWCDVKLV